jgi:hypothetical protein
MANLLRGLGAALVALLLLGLPAAAATGTAPSPTPPLGGAVLHYLPDGLGTSSDFSYQFARVRFAARVWESGSDADGWQVDLHVIVMHGARLRTPLAFHDWFIRYEQRPAGEAQYGPARVRHHRAWLARDQVFWLAHPGVAVSVQLDRSRWSRWQVLHTARSIAVPVPTSRSMVTETGTRSNLAT